MFETQIHDSILAAGTFQFFKNQPAALAYLNGQLMLRKQHLKKFQMFENLVGKFEKSGLTKRFMKII